MALLGLHIDLPGGDKITKILETEEKKIKDFSGLFNKIADYFQGKTSAPAGSPVWNITEAKGYPIRFKDLSKKYKDWKQKVFGHIYPILVASGELLRSLKGGKNSIRKVSNSEMIVGTKVHYGYYHQVSGIGDRTLRQFFTAGKYTQTAIAKIMQKHLAK